MIGLGVLCGLAVVVFLATRSDELTDDGGPPVSLGDPIFSPGPADEFAAVIADEGPIFLPDLAQGDKDIWLQHLGDDVDEGWIAFAVRQLEDPKECFADWDGGSRTFVGTCDETAYPENGDGLQQFPVSVDPDGDLIINLNTSPDAP